MVACRNHGKSSYDRNFSSSSSSSQSPLAEIFVTSTVKVFPPCGSDQFHVITNFALDGIQFPLAKAAARRKLNVGFHPKLCFAAGRREHVNMCTRFLTRKE